MSTVLVVDDHAPLRDYLATHLNAGEFTVTGVAGDGRSALDAAAALRPDLVVLDGQLPDMDGLEVAERLADGRHPPGVVITSTRPAVDFGPRLAHGPVLGFVPKAELSVEAIRRLVSASRTDEAR